MNTSSKKNNWIPFILIGGCLLATGIAAKDAFINFTNGDPQLEVAAQGNQRAKTFFQPIFAQLPILAGETVYKSEKNYAEPPQQSGYKCPCQGRVTRSLEQLVIMRSVDDTDFDKLTQQFVETGWVAQQGESSPVVSQDTRYQHASLKSMTGVGGTAHLVKISSSEEVGRIGLDPRRYMDFSIGPEGKTKLLQHFARSSMPVYGYTVYLSYTYAEGRLP